MADTTYVNGTVVQADWLNDVNDFVYTDVAAPSGASLVGFLQTGTGAVAQTAQAKMRQTVDVADFGAPVSGDASAAFLAAGTAVAALGGGVVSFRLNYSILTNLTVPDNVHLQGQLISPGQIQDGGVGGDYDSLGSVLKVASSATITLGSASSLSNCILIRSGLDLPFADLATAQAGVPLFAGTAVTIAGDSARVENTLILGFAKAISCANRGKVSFYNVHGDCTDGIDVSGALDVVYLDQCHFWPFTTANYSWTASDATQLILTRGGVAFHFHDTVDWPKITNCFSYGYFRGILLHNTNAAEVIGCSADGPVSAGVPVHANSVGFLIEGSAVDNKLISCYAAGKAQGYNFNATSGHVEVAHSDAVACSIGVYALNTQGLAWFGGLLRACNYGIQVDVSGTHHFHGTKIRDYVTKPVNVTVATTGLQLFDCNFLSPAAGAAVADGMANWTLFPIASADPLNLPNSVGETILVTGTTGFGTMNGGYPGRKVTLLFGGSLTVLNGASMRLSASANFAAVSGSSISFVYTGTQWREIGRCA